MLAFDATTNLQCEIQSEQLKNFKPFRTYLCHFFQLLQSEVSPLITLLVLQVREQLFTPSLVDYNPQKQLGKVSKLRIPYKKPPGLQRTLRLQRLSLVSCEI